MKTIILLLIMLGTAIAYYKLGRKPYERFLDDIKRVTPNDGIWHEVEIKVFAKNLEGKIDIGSLRK